MLDLNVMYVYNTKHPTIGSHGKGWMIQWTVIIALIAILNIVDNLYWKYIQIFTLLRSFGIDFSHSFNVQAF